MRFRERVISLGIFLIFLCHGAGGDPQSVAVKVSSVTPDWVWSGTPTPFALNGNFTMPPGYIILSATVTLSFGGASQFVVNATSISASSIVVSLPGLPEILVYDVSLSLRCGTFTGDNVFQVQAQERPRLKIASPVRNLGNATVGAGPPNGGTLISFDLSTVNASSLDCAFGSIRSPATLNADQTNGTCVSPMMQEEQRVCVQLVPRNTSYLMYSSIQNSSSSENAGCDVNNSFPFSYYDQVPFPTSLSPRFGLSTGGATAVLIEGYNFPVNAANAVLCKFGSVVIPGFAVNVSNVLCSTYPTANEVGFSEYASPDGTLIVPVSISFNNGVDFTPVSVEFMYVPIMSISSAIAIYPAFGVLSGKTHVSVNVSFSLNGGVPVLGPLGLCINGQKVPGSLVACNETSTCVFATPPSLSVGVVNVTLLQEDNATCGPNPAQFTYVPDWIASGSNNASVITGGGSMNVSVPGSNFFASSGSSCLARAVWPRNSNIPDICAVRGELFVESANSSVCSLELHSSFYECAYSAAVDSDHQFLWQQALGVNLAVSMNGVDYATLANTEAGSTEPVFIRAVRLPVIEALHPNYGIDSGGYILEVALQTGVSWYVTSCLFSDSDIALEVRAAPYSLKAVACTVPQWWIDQSKNVSVVQVQLRVNAATISAPADFTFFKSPRISQVSPYLGTAGLSETLSVFGSGFEIVFSVSLQCVFAKQYVSPAVIISDSELECVSPSTSAGTYTLEFLVNWASRVSVIHDTFFTVGDPPFLHALQNISFTPVSGPTAGGTLVGISSLGLPDRTGLVRCGFGNIIVSSFYVSPDLIACESPLIQTPGSLSLSISLDSQTLINMGSFAFYPTESVASVSPATGPAVGGTLVLVRGARFLNSTTSACRFGHLVTPMVKFVSPQLVMCVSPPGTVGQADVSVANNGADFRSVLKGGFEYQALLPLLSIHPFLGPVSGKTSVLIQANTSSLANAVSCSFGLYTVPATTIRGSNQTNITCITPAVEEAMTVSVSVLFATQYRTFTNQQFVFHADQQLTSIYPPQGLQGAPKTIAVYGTNFYDSELLTVRIGTPSVGFVDIVAVFVSNSEIRAEIPLTPPRSGILRLPVFVANNGHNFVPSAAAWNPDDDSYEAGGLLKFYTFLLPTLLKSVDPQFAVLGRQGYVSVRGGPFIDSEFTACGFNKTVSSSTSLSRPVLVSPSHILCPLPDFSNASSIVLSVQLQIGFLPNEWSQSYLNFTFLTLSPRGSSSSAASTGGLIVPCRPGFMCETRGVIEPMQCAPGTYQPFPGQLQCAPCPKGFYCPQARLIEPVICPNGWICDEENLVIPHKLCPGGYVCLAGSLRRCMQGMYCFPGTSSLVSVPGNFSTPQPCFQTAYCKPGSDSPFGSGSIPLGRYSPTPLHAGKVCPPRFFCGPVTGNVEPRPCAPGSFNAMYGQHNCSLAYEGSMAPTAMMIEPIASDCGYFAGRKGVSALTQYDLCPPGMVCGFGTASDSNLGICVAVSNASECASGNFYLKNSFVSSRLNSSASSYCCWTSQQVSAFLKRLENIVAASGQRLEALAARRFRQSVQAINSTGFDGLALLEQVTRASLTATFKVHIGKVRERILLEIERYFSFPAPAACAPGVFCNRGTCAGLAPVVSVTLER